MSNKRSLELDVERDFGGQFPIKKRYCIISTPRSGSTLVSRVLYETGLAGDPLEYFNAMLMRQAGYVGENEIPDVSGFLGMMEKRRTSPNGVFGIKIHYYQYASVVNVRSGGFNIESYFSGFDKFVFIRRRSKIDQAISLALAKKSGVWSSEDRNKNPAPPKVSLLDCLESLYKITQQEAAWQSFIAYKKLNVHSLWYEDLISNYDQEFKRLFDYLEIPAIVVPAPPIEKQAGVLNQDLKASLIKYLGLDG